MLAGFAPHGAPFFVPRGAPVEPSKNARQLRPEPALQPGALTGTTFGAVLPQVRRDAALGAGVPARPAVRPRPLRLPPVVRDGHPDDRRAAADRASAPVSRRRRAVYRKNTALNSNTLRLGQARCDFAGSRGRARQHLARGRQRRLPAAAHAAVGDRRAAGRAGLQPPARSPRTPTRQGVGAVATASATPAPPGQGKNDGCSTKDVLLAQVNFEPHWLQVLPGRGPVGADVARRTACTATARRWAAATKAPTIWSVGLAANIPREVQLRLKYNDSHARYTPARQPAWSPRRTATPRRTTTAGSRSPSRPRSERRHSIMRTLQHPDRRWPSQRCAAARRRRRAQRRRSRAPGQRRSRRSAPRRPATRTARIPEWTGGLCTPPAGYKPLNGERLSVRRPVRRREAAVLDRRARTWPSSRQARRGRAGAVEAVPATYRVDVYPTHRTACFPNWVYDNTIKNVMNAEAGGRCAGPRRRARADPVPDPEDRPRGDVELPAALHAGVRRRRLRRPGWSTPAATRRWSPRRASQPLRVLGQHQDQVRQTFRAC